MFELIRRAALTALVCVLFAVVARDAHADAPIPEPLKPWTTWAMRGKEDALCPTFDGDATATPRCAWPSRLDLVLDEKRGTFVQRWHVDARRWVPLPGDEKRWPLDATVDDKRSVVVARSGAPSVELEPGDHVVRGTFAWDSLPESLHVPAQTALLSLTLRGKGIDQPNRDADGTLWLQKTVAADEGERLDFVVHRKIVDEVPLLLTTRIVLNVAGRNREVLLGRALPAGFVPMALESQLPARVEPDTRLRIQARPGTWTIELVARSEGPVTKIQRPTPDGPWRDGEEVWVFEARNQLRVVNVRGVAAIDPQQTSLPDPWKALPAYPLGPNDTLELVEKRRGDTAAPGDTADQLSLQRSLWLDFDGHGFTASDVLTGRLRHASRLEMLPPTVLGRVSIASKDQFITHLEGDAEKTGVELREGNLNVTADSRVLADPGDMPAVGWNHDFHFVSGILHLPPGYRLFHATGVDDVGDTWLKHWTLLELFLVLVLAIGVARLYGAKWGAVAFATLVLAFPEAGAPRYILAFVLGAEAVARALDKATARAEASPVGPSRALVRGRSLAGVVRGVFAAVLVLASIAFVVDDVRHGLFPALSVSSLGTETMHDDEIGFAALGAKRAPAAPAESAPSDMPKGGDDGDSNVDATKTAEPAQKIWPAGSASSSVTYRQFNANVYDPSSMVQTGPGRPRWQYTSVPLTWSGPVERSQRLHLFLMTPSMNAALAILRALLVAALVLRLLPVRPRRLSGALSFTTAAFAFLVVMAPGAAHAQTVPPKEVLDDLAARILEKPACSPSCASSSRLLIEATPGALRLRMEIEASAATAVPLPASGQWEPKAVLVDGKPAKALLRADDGKVWLAVERGWHQAILEGPMPDRELVQISLPLLPHRVETQTEGWRAEGIHEDGLADDNVQLTRIRGKKGGAALEPGVLPPFVRVERTILVGLDWQVMTRVVRLSPPGSAIVLEVPLLDGESVTTADVRVVARKAQLNMPPNATEVTWRSVLDQRSPITLTAPRSATWTELWRVDPSPIWHVDVEGAPVIHADPAATSPEWRPWPGETVKLSVSRPAGVSGRTLTIDAVDYALEPGARSTSATLTLTVRSSRGAQHTLTLPERAEVESVTVNGTPTPIRPDGRRLTVPVSPGTQSLEVKFRLPSGIGPFFRAPEIDVGAPSVNATTTVKLGDARWVLGLSGPRVGPVVLFWGVLAVFFVVAALVGAMKRTPLSIVQWLLLAIGLSQVSVVAGAIVAFWFHVVAWRERRIELGPRSFNFRQLVIVAGTAVALVVLLAAVDRGLLGHPDMQIAGNGSSASNLRWFSDREGAALAAPAVLSVPMTVYRVAMLAWALWLAVSVVGWLRWAFRAFGAGGFWRRPPPPPVPPANLPHRTAPLDADLEGPPAPAT